MFKNRTTLFFLIASTLHAVAFMPSNYLLPQMFQGVNGSGALRSGIDLLPYACGVSWSTVIGQLPCFFPSRPKLTTSWPDKFQIKDRKTSSMGRIRPSWNRNDLILRLLQIPNPIRSTRRSTGRNGCRGRVIAIDANLDFASGNAIEGNGSCY